MAPYTRVVHPVRVGDDLTPDVARGPRYRRTGSGLFVPVAVDNAVAQQRIVEEAARLPPFGAVTGWASCLLHGAARLDGLAPDGRTRLPVALAVGPRGGVRKTSGIVVSFERLPEWEVCQRCAIRVARPERAVFDEMRRHDRSEALVVLESALAGRITSLQRFAAYAEAHRSARRFDVVAWALPRARGGARSPLEVRVRTIAEEHAGYGRLLVNRVVETLEGVRIGEVDLIDEESGTTIEVDGADHRNADRRAWDITKEEALRRVGLETARVTGSQSLNPATPGRATGRRTRSIALRATCGPSLAAQARGRRQRAPAPGA
ncbi:hypothetical protein [Nocardioides sp. B-3]|uniref:hypothetical protein n=1 Tax=Nocardioides sp. B-3 TaxID=2895565 RepID=UPI0021529FB1|nr:hypothetical protein [Nocardioides sp. B-3]UUZ61028.1 hypothetical protein LP418_10375 [Nocardioides sp. B-3]